MKLPSLPHFGFWRTLLTTVAKNPISFFAVGCVAATAIFLGYMTHRLASVLESSGWCAKAIQAEKISPGAAYVGLTTCVDLLKIQLEAMATGFHISVGSFALTLLFLIVVVVAGARASWKVSATGIEGNIGKEIDEAADKVADAAVDKAAEIKDETYNGPAMPEPKK